PLQSRSDFRPSRFMPCGEVLRLFHGAGDQLERRGRRVAPVAETQRKVTFKTVQDGSEVVGMGARRSLRETKVQFLPGDLQEVEEFVDLQQRQWVAEDAVAVQQEQNAGP